MNPDFRKLIDAAKPLVRRIILGRPDFDAATVAAAIRSSTGKTYTGVCIHLSCGIGFCAEHAAAAEMIKAGETQIEMIVAVADDCILSPCGRCREFLMQVNPKNADAYVILSENKAVRLHELLPHHWLTQTYCEQTYCEQDAPSNGG
jgi:cytidine deaminase